VSRARILNAATLAASVLLAAVSLARADDEVSQNLFISPAGEPFLAPADAPYPIVDWFNKADKNHDGKLDADEFRADAEAFFRVLDRNQDGVLTSGEIYYYEHRIAPEILNNDHASINSPGFIRVQGPGGLSGSSSIDPGDPHFGEGPSPQPRARFAEGAAYYSLFNEPEPVTAADRNFDFKITLNEFLDQADRHFATLDVKRQGYLTLAALPHTTAEDAVHAKRFTTLKP